MGGGGVPVGAQRKCGGDGAPGGSRKVCGGGGVPRGTHQVRGGGGAPEGAQQAGGGGVPAGAQQVSGGGRAPGVVLQGCGDGAADEGSSRGCGGGVVAAGGPLGTAQPIVDSGWAERFPSGFWTKRPRVAFVPPRPRARAVVQDWGGSGSRGGREGVRRLVGARNSEVGFRVSACCAAACLAQLPARARVCSGGTVARRHRFGSLGPSRDSHSPGRCSPRGAWESPCCFVAGF